MSSRKPRMRVRTLHVRRSRVSTRLRPGLLVGTPNLAIKIEPVESGKATFLPLAPPTANGQALVKIVLRLDIQNNESQSVTVTGIRFSFPNSQYQAVDMQGVDLANLTIAPSAKAYWSNGRVDLDPDPNTQNIVNNTVFLNAPGPSKITVSVFCQGYPFAATTTMSLAAHKTPNAAGSYLFPYAAGDLRKGEFFQTSSVHWANGGAMGGQIFAHDIGVIGGSSWSLLLPGKSGSKNEDYRIWGVPVRAVADGVVEDWDDGMADNTVLGQFPTPTPNPVGGNNIWIKHGDELVQYCHLMKDSMPKDLQVKGVKVKAGQTLGLVGNTGNSTNPHTHIQCHRYITIRPLRPFPFRNTWVVDASKLSPPSMVGPWSKLSGHGIPKDTVAVWPASTYPGFPVPTFGISMGGTWANSFWTSPDLASFKKQAQKLFDDKGRRLVRVTTFVENGKRRWVGISRSGNWANRWWISNNLTAFKQKAQQLFDDHGLRLIHVHTYVEGGQRKWVGISRSGNWANRLFIKSDLASFKQEAQKLFDQNGLRLIHVTTYMQSGTRRWLGISRSGDWANRWWISPDFASFNAKAQQLFDDEGKRLIYATTYVEGGKRKWVGISRSGNWANWFYFRKDLDSFRLTAQQLFDGKGLRLVHVEMLE